MGWRQIPGAASGIQEVLQGHRLVVTEVVDPLDSRPEDGRLGGSEVVGF
jgi:hypothetical protein